MIDPKLPLLFMAAIAAGGLLLTVLVALKVRFPAWLGLGHGLGGLAGLGLLFASNVSNPQTPALAWWALGVFLGGFVGGVLLFRVLFKDRATLPLALMHGSVGSLGLYLLFLAGAPAG